MRSRPAVIARRAGGGLTRMPDASTTVDEDASSAVNGGVGGASLSGDESFSAGSCRGRNLLLAGEGCGLTLSRCEEPLRAGKSDCGLPEGSGFHPQRCARLCSRDRRGRAAAAAPAAPLRCSVAMAAAAVARRVARRRRRDLLAVRISARTATWLPLCRRAAPRVCPC